MQSATINTTDFFIRKIIDICSMYDVGNVYNIYSYGSRVYGVNKSESDYDFIVVADKTIQDTIKVDNVDITTYGVDDFRNQLNNNEISVIEAISTIPLKGDIVFDFNVNLSMLRKAISAKSSNSYVKAKKKITVENDIFIGLKSLFHSIRIPMFGMQIAMHNKIIDFTVANEIYYDIMNTKWIDWKDLSAKYKLKFNQVQTEFRKIVPKS